MFKSSFSLFGSEILFDDFPSWTSWKPSNDRDIIDLEDIFKKNMEKKSGGLRKIGDLPPRQICKHPEHNPPLSICLSPGIYEYTCPSCEKTTTFIVNPLNFQF